MDLETNNSATPSQEHYDAQNDGVDENTGLNYKEWNGIDELESMCMRCGETGKTRFMLHKIPFFRELILASFICEECGERNNEVTFGGEIQLQGSIFNLYLTCGKDLDRQIIKSDSASIKIKEIDFEIPPLTQKGEINTIEGILRTASKNLQHGQPLRMIDSPEIAQKVGAVISKLNDMADGTFLPFTLLLDDPAGNSFIQNLHAPKVDPHMSVHHYQRTAEQDAILGLDSTKGTFKDDTDSTMKSIVEGRRKFGEAPTESKPEDENNGMIVLGRTEAVSIASLCPNCSQAGESLTALTDIPHFKEVMKY